MSDVSYQLHSGTITGLYDDSWALIEQVTTPLDQTVVGPTLEGCLDYLPSGPSSLELD